MVVSLGVHELLAPDFEPQLLAYLYSRWGILGTGSSPDALVIAGSEGAD
jgi:hypothetical protein